MEEDNHAPKQAILSFLYGRSCSRRPLFHRLRFQLFRSMGCRARVMREECEQVGGRGGLGERGQLEKGGRGGWELGFEGGELGLDKGR